MKVNGETVKAQPVNVVPLFGTMAQDFRPDPMTELLMEIETAPELPPIRAERRRVAREDHFPEQGMYILDQQLGSLKENLSRIKYYLSDLDDLLPKA